MSDEDQSNVNSQEEEQDEQQNSQQQDDQQDDDEEDDQQGSGDEDEDQDQDQENEESGSGQDDQEEDEDQSKQEQQEQQQDEKKLPTFKMVPRDQPQQFKFTSLLSQLSSISNSVDGFIGTLHSSNSFSRRPIHNYAVQQTTYQPRLEQIRVPQTPTQSRVVIMKDQDTQVDMKPQIIIQPTKQIKQDPITQSKPYKISNQSEKFLAQLYQQNKKLKRWQTNTNHPMNSYMTSFSGTNSFGGTNKGFYGSKDKFQRKQYQKGLFNVQQRNKQIDEAILMLKRQEQDY